MIRVEKWRSKFAEQADDIRTKPFVWGQHDCAVGLVGNLTQALVGENLAAEYTGKYTDAKSAYKVMKKAGFDNLADMAASILPEIHISQAQIGDIAAVPVDTNFGFALGVVNGERILVLREDGMGTVDLLDATRAFKVG